MERLQCTQTERCSAPCAPPPASDVPDHPGLTPCVWCVWWMLRCLILYPWSQSDTNKITGWMGAPDTVIRPWDRDPQGLSGLYLDLNFLKNNSIPVISNDKQCIDWGDLVAPNQPWCYCSRCTVHCIVLQGLLSLPGASVSGPRSLIIHTHNSHPGIAHIE